jgi:hypothetical protein
MRRSRRTPGLARIFLRQRPASRTVEGHERHPARRDAAASTLFLGVARDRQYMQSARRAPFSPAVSLRPHRRRSSLEVGGSTCVAPRRNRRYRAGASGSRRRARPALSPQEPASPRPVVSRPTGSAAPGKRGTYHEEGLGSVGEHCVACERWRGVRTATDAEAVRQLGRSPAPTEWNQDGAGGDDA